MWQIIQEPSTKKQRKALYALGRSVAWVKKYATTKEAASQLIPKDIETMGRAKQLKEKAAIK